MTDPQTPSLDDLERQARQWLRELTEAQQAQLQPLLQRLAECEGWPQAEAATWRELQQLQRHHEAARLPLVRHLARILALQPPRLLLSIERARELGLVGPPLPACRG